MFHLVLMHAVISTLGVVLIVTPTDWCTIPTGQSLINLNDILYVWYLDVIAFSQFLGGIRIILIVFSCDIAFLVAWGPGFTQRTCLITETRRLCTCRSQNTGSNPVAPPSYSLVGFLVQASC